MPPKDVQARTFWFQFVSHNLIRWFALPLLILLALVNLALVCNGVIVPYGLLLLGLCGSLGLALRGHWLARQSRQQPRLIYLCYYFYLVNLAALLGIYDETRGIRHTKWEHVRSAATTPAESNELRP